MKALKTRFKVILIIFIHLQSCLTATRKWQIGPANRDPQLIARLKPRAIGQPPESISPKDQTDTQIHLALNTLHSANRENEERIGEIKEERGTTEENREEKPLQIDPIETLKVSFKNLD